jgi:hypothetical protein
MVHILWMTNFRKVMIALIIMLPSTSFFPFNDVFILTNVDFVNFNHMVL